ncbi:MAG TPA: twin-arginine translocation signal domain-containing protein, partial [Microlunatus sp.]
MDRRHFITTVGVASAAVAAGAVLEENWAQAEPHRDPTKRPPAVVDDRFLDTLTTINDLQVPNTLAGYQAQIDTLASPRALAQSAMRLVSAYVNPRGANHHDGALIGIGGPVDRLLVALAERQNPSGLYDIGNLDSPPDTSFVIADLGLSYVLLAGDDQPATVGLRAQYAAIMRKAGTALAEGGVHTPNHRWEICKALAHLHHLWPSRLLKARINDWLGEGIDQDGEGEYSERSPNYASEVTNKSLLTVARYLDKPRLRDNVRR